MDIASEDFEPPPRRFRHHTTILGLLASVAAVFTLLIVWLVPNEGHGPVLGIDGLRDALLILLWSAFAIFAAASTAVLAVVPGRWNSFVRLALAYIVGYATLAAVTWLLANHSR